MAVFDTTTRAPAISAGHITRTIENLIGNLKTWNDARVTRKHLSNLSARELDDIGLTYADIAKVCKTARR